MQPFWKIVWRFLKKLKIELFHNLGIALLLSFASKAYIVIRRGTYTPMFIAAMSTIAKLWIESRCPSTYEWIKMEIYVYVCTHTHTHTLEYYSAIKKLNSAIVTTMATMFL